MAGFQCRRVRGRYLVAMPDLVENFDILSAMRDPQTLMMDTVDRPVWVAEKITHRWRSWGKVRVEGHVP